VARVLIVGCGCRGRALAAALVEDGHQVRGTTRSPDRVPQIEESGADGVVADPNVLGTLLPAIEGVSAVCWLLGNATGDPEVVAALHGDRLSSLLAKLVDTPVRGFVYEGSAGTEIARTVASTFQMPIETVDPADPAWLETTRAALRRILT
jgi:nucleoside-diphosphate-sugar epimerase